MVAEARGEGQRKETEPTVEQVQWLEKLNPCFRERVVDLLRSECNSVLEEARYG
jgi:hypothetical protein